MGGGAVLERDAAGVASTPDDVLVANIGGSCTGEVNNEEIIVACFESREISVLFSTESAMTARAAKADAAGR